MKIEFQIDTFCVWPVIFCLWAVSSFDLLHTIHVCLLSYRYIPVPLCSIPCLSWLYQLFRASQAYLCTAYAVPGQPDTPYLVYGFQAGQGSTYAVRHPHLKQSLSHISFLMMLRCKIFQWIRRMHQSTKKWTLKLYFYTGYCTAAYVSLYCLGVRYPSEYAGRSSLKILYMLPSLPECSRPAGENL